MGDSLSEWLATRPLSVQRLAAEFPPGTRLICHGRVLHVIGWTEGDDLIVSAHDPYEDYDAANESREYVCASHYRLPGGHN